MSPKSGLDEPGGAEVIGLIKSYFSDQEALSVAPYTFNSVEQEGRWKNRDWAYNYERDLINPAMATPTLPNDDAQGGLDVLNASGAIPPGASVSIPANSSPPSSSYEQQLFDLTIKGGPGTVLDVPSRALITVLWYADQLEIWGGYSGLALVDGFFTPYGDQAGIMVSGTPYGNYLPAVHMLTVSGWVNPARGLFTDFRCAALITAGKNGITQLFGTAWYRREPKMAPSLQWKHSGGWALALQAPA
jgi:hypothetical protein